MRKIQGLVKGAMLGVAVGAVSLLCITPQAEAGGRSSVSISVGFPIGDHGYLSVGSSRSYGYGRSYHRGYGSYRHGYGYDHHHHYSPVYVRPISRVCYDPWPGYYSSRSRVIVYDSPGAPGVYRYSSADGLGDDTRVYNVANDNAGYMSSQSLAAESSLPADASYGTQSDREAAAARPTYAQQRRANTTTASRPYIKQPAETVTLDDAYAMLDRNEDAEAQRAFAGLIARNPRNSHATVGYGLSSAALGQVDRAERAFAQANAANANVWDNLGQYPATRAMALTLLSDSKFAESKVMRAPLDRLSIAAQPEDLAMPDFGRVAGRE